jgi:hypothetical protein
MCMKEQETWACRRCRGRRLDGWCRLVERRANRRERDGQRRFVHVAGTEAAERTWTCEGREHVRCLPGSHYHPKEQSTHIDITSTETSDSILGCRC